MRQSMILLGAVLGVAGCNQAADNSVANASAAEKPRPKYCFFKDSETKAWSASRDKQGNIVVKGKAYRSDPRYQAQLSEPEVSGNKAIVRPSIAQNASGFAAPDNWWDVATTILNSAAIETVTVECGPKTLAELKVPPKKS